MATLTGQGKMDNFFSALLSGRFPSTMDGKAFFVDRSSVNFGLLLHWLRTGTDALFVAECIRAIGLFYYRREAR
jgi:hypothetical protein